MSLYRNYRTRTFDQIFPTFDGETDSSFKYFYTNCGITPKITNTSLSTLYYLLLARYANFNISSSDENRFKFQVMSIIFQYGPTWEKELDIQDKLRNLTEAELLTGAKSINNHAYNPSTAPSTDSTTELTTINEQHTVKYQKAKMTAYAELVSVLERDVTEKFLKEFKKLFVIFPAPLPIWFETDTEEEGENQ